MPRSLWLCLWLTAAAAFVAAGCGAVPVDEAQAPIIGGTTDATDSAVVLLVQGSFGGSAVTLCTAEVIAPHVLLTAAHCLVSENANVVPAFTVVLDQQLNGLGLVDGPPVASVHPHPLYTSKVFGTYDIGIVLLATPVAVTPLPYNQAPLDASLIGSSVRLIGYGVTQGSDTSAMTAGVRNVTTSTLSAIAAATITVGDSANNDCQGDSGGPALLTMAGVETIIGTTSYGTKGCTSPTTDARVDAYAADFIAPYVNLAEGNGGSTDGVGGYTLGSVGAPCLLNDDCTSGLCANAGHQGFCTAMCSATAPCPSGTHCGAAGGGQYCISDLVPTGGCSLALHGTSTPGAFFVLVAGVAWASVRSSRRRARRAARPR